MTLLSGVGPKAFVLGSPISHSKSPLLHQAAYNALGESIDYQRKETQGEDLPAVFAQHGPHDDTCGFSVTMPLKTAILDYLDELTPFARAVGVVNTVYWREGVKGWSVWGHNTDVSGIVNALKTAGAPAELQTGAIVGGGGTATAALAGLAYMGLKRVDVFVRNPARAHSVVETAKRLGVTVQFEPLEAFSHRCSLYEVNISTLPAGAADNLMSDTTSAQRTQLGILLDVTYDPWPSSLAQLWQERGGKVTSGLEMLMYQAVDQVKLFTGRSLEQRLPSEDKVIEAMRSSVGLPPAEVSPQMVWDPLKLIRT